MTDNSTKLTLNLFVMKRLLILFFLATALSLLTNAKQVEENTARTVASNFFASRIDKNQLKTLPIPVLVCTSNDLKTGQAAATKAAPAFYVFNFTGNTGFIIISGDDIVTPVLAYSMEGSFSPAQTAPAAASWLNWYEEQIKDAVAGKLVATSEIESAWHDLAATGKSNLTNKSGNAVGPLIKLHWNQSPYYNQKCPWYFYKDKTGKITDSALAVTGCVATAMAMVMKYHNYPRNGTGFYSYKTGQGGTLKADFGKTMYNWVNMPDTLSDKTTKEEDEAVSTLMSHCGIAVEMNYGDPKGGGSGAQVISGGENIKCTETALKTYFDYDPGMKGLSRLSYTDAEWTDLIKEDLNAGLPLLYAASELGQPGGHAFICDGYDNTGKFHINWGWGNSGDDGYFEINALIGGGSKYICGQDMIKGVRPMSGQGKYFNLNLSAPVTLLPNILLYDDSISVSSMIRNNGTTIFNGSLGAAIYDTNQMRIGFVQIDNPVTIEPGERLSVNFRNSGLSHMLPGKYLIGIMYSSIGDGWKEVNDTLTYINFPMMEVINPDVIKMASVMTILPGNPLTQGKTATVKLEIMNAGSQNFSGILNLAIHDIDGSYLYSLAQKSNFTLPAGSSSGELAFITGSIPVSAGSYLLALWYKPTGNSEYDLIGSTGFQNPVIVQVNAVPLQPDKYEPNNVPDSASVLPLSFSGKQVKIIVKANCHVGKDRDYYKIQLPIGYSYHGSAFLRNSEDDTTFSYPLNGFWTFLSTQDTVYQAPCNNSAPAEFTALKGGDLYFYVYPNFVFQTGMYQLEINISQNPLGIEESGFFSTLAIYPNPSSGIVYLANHGDKGIIADITVRNMLGTTVYRQPAASVGTDPYSIDLSGLASGIYIVTISENMNQRRNMKVSIAK